jgi:hypothetical protein
LTPVQSVRPDKGVLVWKVPSSTSSGSLVGCLLTPSLGQISFTPPNLGSRANLRDKDAKDDRKILPLTKETSLQRIYLHPRVSAQSFCNSRLAKLSIRYLHTPRSLINPDTWGKLPKIDWETVIRGSCLLSSTTSHRTTPKVRQAGEGATVFWVLVLESACASLEWYMCFVASLTQQFL